MQHAAPGYNPAVCALGLLHAQGEVLFKFLFEAVVDVARGAIFALFAEEGGVVDGEEHRHRRLVDGNRGQRLGVFKIANRVADFKILESHHGANVARLHAVGLLPRHALEGMHLLDFRFLKRAVAVGDGAVHAFGNASAMHAPHGDTPRVVGIVQRGDEHLRRTFELRGGGNGLNYFVKKIVNVFGRLIKISAHPAVLG